MSLIQQRQPLSHEEELKYAKLAMEWYGWGSPIGLGILLVALAAAAVLLCMLLVVLVLRMLRRRRRPLQRLHTPLHVPHIEQV